jgi:hypothetical protein
MLQSIREQLGLRLRAATAAADVVAIDASEQPDGD